MLYIIRTLGINLPSPFWLFPKTDSKIDLIIKAAVSTTVKVGVSKGGQG